MVGLSSLGGAGWQFFDNNGVPLSGGKLYTYAAGTTTPATTYTSSSGATPHANPIILDSAGRVSSEVWLTSGAFYKFRLDTSTDVTIWTKDNIPGIFPDAAITAADVEYDPPYAGALTSGYTVEDKLAQTVSVKDFGAVGDGVTDDTAAIQAALNSGSVFIPETDNFYLISDDLIMVDGSTVFGVGYKSQIRQTAQGKNGFVAGHNCVVRNIRVKMPVGNNLDFTKQNAVYIDGKVNVTVQDNWLELADISVSGVQARGQTANLQIKGNIIYGGGWSSGSGGAESASDILLYNSTTSSRIIIDGNYCLSNNSQGIYADALGDNTEVIITNNICVTLDPATCTQGGTWSEIANGGRRRHGIILGYNDTSSNGPRSIVSGNICRNTRWTGIYLQGTSVGRVCTNNLCSNNGYDTSNSLSGGIFLSQNGYELIEGNTILDFKNTDTTGVGAITVLAPAAPPIAPSVIRGNFIQNSASAGIFLTRRAALLEVSDNTIINSTTAAIYISPSAGVTDVAGHHIVNNRIWNTIGNTVRGIIFDQQSSTLVTRIHGNRIRGNDNLNNSVNNSAIYATASSSYCDIKNNTFENFYYGLYFTNYQTTNRDAQIESNTFVNCSIGIDMSATTANVTVPVVDNRFIGILVSEISSALGADAARICTREGQRLVAQTYTASPTNGSWEIGDRAMFNTPVAGGDIGAVCVTAGTPGTWKTYGAIAP